MLKTYVSYLKSTFQAQISAKSYKVIAPSSLKCVKMLTYKYLV